MRVNSILVASLSCLSNGLAAPNGGGRHSDLPIVDLKYELHQAISFNSTRQYYNFSNIRYAQPPIGEFRFAAPQPPKVDRKEVQKGDLGRICPQASPAWFATQTGFILDYLGIPIPPRNSSSVPSVSIDPRTTEDCLFLDVLVPKKAWDGRYGQKKAPVLVWIYGGGYTVGEKSSFLGSPVGLLERAENDLVFVSMNYRVGAFGFLSGPTFQADGGTANAGLLDQRLALQWIQENISKFGGDPDEVTVIGESAGGGSIIHHITAYGGLKGRAPFARAIPQSPGFLPTTSSHQQESTFQKYMSLLNVSTLAEARRVPSEAVIRANIAQVNESITGTFAFGPVVDGSFTPALPGQLLARGQFDKRLDVMHAFNSQEGLLFTPSYVTNEEAFRNYTAISLPTIEPETLDYLFTELYPPVFDGSTPYKDHIGRAAFSTSESIFICNTRYLATAYGGKTFGYEFTIFPGLHGLDLPYTFYDGEPAKVTGNVNIALEHQRAIVSFAKSGDPGFPVYGANSTIRIYGSAGVSTARDPNANKRCDWWQKALYA
ncbi:acetylcholinesterase precursor [Eremomyces bilateralis CBS 781.70]|uniref:Carboxylic ester hydrolase n=1 Tax=Eremomyces bilateralis CBS 781.70 TaxID=1392243 RepID=A0A6G1FYI6_9PEZI|nr:acetylcholinesterase precursor [Eremomyces bilateralis CBS 781.70]KAF1810853.1 acetylcholinesterase precursor [Eremomyces bilateralis CBS 781.70]